MQKTVLRNARILMVDDQEANLLLLESILHKAGYTNITNTSDSRRVVALYAEIQPDLVLLDLIMPHMDGFAVMKQLASHVPRETYLPILVVSADSTPQARQRALSMGAKDFVAKPFDATEVVLRIHNLLITRYLHLELRNRNQALEQQVRERTRELEQAQIEIVDRLAQAAEYRDDDTHGHAHRVGQLTALVGQELGLPQAEVNVLRSAAALHDIGKIGVPDRILLKPDQLTPEEAEVMKAHTVIGSRLLSGSRSRLLQVAEEIALTHHERWDGNGYSPGLGGETIPLAGRIVAVADAFDALTHDRPYRKARPVKQAIEELQQQAGRQFDPRVVEALLRVVARSRNEKKQVAPRKLYGRSSGKPESARTKVDAA